LEYSVQDLPAHTRFAVYSDAKKQLWTVSSHEGVRSQLEAGRSDIFTIVPVWEGDTAEFAPVGLTNMLNTGGTISGWTPDNGGSKFTFKVRARHYYKKQSATPGRELLLNILPASCGGQNRRRMRGGGGGEIEEYAF